MATRAGIALAILIGITSMAAAQVVRFETTVGSFDMVLNPNNLPVLQEHVDNMLQYVRNGNYNGSWINRAPETATGDGFVLQMGGLFSDTKRAPLSKASTRSVARFPTVIGAPAAANGLSNTAGTVSLALSGNNPNSGSSSFFINTTDNSFLNQQFTVFAAIADMTVVDQIMTLPDIDLSDSGEHPLFDVLEGEELTYMDVPVDANGFLVLIKRAFVVTDSIVTAQAFAAVESTMTQSAAAAAATAASAAGAAGASSGVQLASSVVPEPSSLLLAALAMFWALSIRRPGR